MGLKIVSKKKKEELKEEENNKKRGIRKIENIQENYNINLSGEDEKIYIYYKELFLSKLNPLINQNFKIKNNEIDFFSNKKKIINIFNIVEQKINNKYNQIDLVDNIKINNDNVKIDSKEITSFINARKEILKIEQVQILNIVKNDIYNNIKNETKKIDKTKEINIKIDKKLIKNQIDFFKKVIKELKKQIELIKEEDKEIYEVIDLIIKSSLSDFRNKFNINEGYLNIKNIIGLGEYTNQLVSYLNYLEDRSVSISHNYFTQKNHIDTAANYMSGRNLEIGAKQNIIDNNLYKKNDLIALSKEKWDILNYYIKILDIYYDDLLYILNKQINIYKEMKKEKDIVEIEEEKIKIDTIIEKLKDEINKRVNEKKEIINEIKQAYIINDDIVDLKKQINIKIENFSMENDKINKKNNNSSINKFFQFKGVNYDKQNYSTSLKDMFNMVKIIKRKNENKEDLRKHEIKIEKKYNKHYNLPLLDFIIKDFNGLIEVKNLTITNNNEINLPFIVDKNNRKYIEENGEVNKGKLKERSRDLYNNQIKKYTKIIDDLEIKKENVFYFIRLYNKNTLTSDVFKIPLKELENMYVSDDILKNSILQKHENYKYKIKIKSDFFKKLFNKYKIQNFKELVVKFKGI